MKRFIAFLFLMCLCGAPVQKAYAGVQFPSPPATTSIAPNPSFSCKCVGSGCAPIPPAPPVVFASRDCALVSAISSVSTANQNITSEFSALTNEVSEDMVRANFNDYIGFNSNPLPSGSFLEFLSNDFYEQSVLPSLQRFAQQMGSIAMQQMAMIGMFFDARQQMQTNLTYQELHVQAHRDYQPSRDFCTFGTNVRSLAGSEEISRWNALALNKAQMARHLAQSKTPASKGADEDRGARWAKFAALYCDPYDNGWDPKAEDPSKTGLAQFCQSPNDAQQMKRRNIDIDFTRLVELPHTLDINYYDEQESEDELDIIALGQNLFGASGHPSGFSTNDLRSLQTQRDYLEYRSSQAKRNVAQSSFNAIVGLKSAGSPGNVITNDANVNTHQFMASILQELGIGDNEEIYDMLGQQPSYYAQLEILGKKLYQSPNFFASLYDKPANLKRKTVAMKAIELMLDRAIYESQTRQEMVISVLLSQQLEDKLKSAKTNLGN